VIQPMLHLQDCVDPAPTESAMEPLHSVGDSVAVEPLHSAADPAAAEPAAKPLQFIADSNAATDALIETSCS
jgi:hypothetical protein